jgi:hypothetical protein
MRKPRNYFNVGVVFDSHAYSVQNRNDVEVTPAVVLKELEDFCARVRRDIAKQITAGEGDAA